MPTHVGIIYRLRLPDPSVFDELMELARSTAEARGWSHAPFEPLRLHSGRVRSADGAIAEAEPLNVGGMWLNLHFGADDLCLVFDRERGRLLDPSRCDPDDPSPVLNDFAVIRTTWADADRHVQMIEFLEALAERQLASVEIGDAAGGTLARDPAAAASAIQAARRSHIEAHLSRPDEPFSLGGVVPFLAPAEATRRRHAPPSPVALLAEPEARAVLKARDEMIAGFADKEPGLTGPPDKAVRALEAITDKLMSHPTYREDPSELLDTHVLQAGVMLGFILIEAFGGHWERSGGPGDNRLRVVNLGGVGLGWPVLESALNRLQVGPLYAHDAIFEWLAGMIDAATPMLGSDA